MNSPVFVKPRKHRKKFPGVVLDGKNTPVVGFSTPVWCSEVVDFSHEFRVFVSNGVSSVVPYPDSGFIPTPASEDFVRDILRAIPEKTMVIDCGWMSHVNCFGVVEVNEAFSFGGYGLPYSKHLDILEARWLELTDF